MKKVNLQQGLIISFSLIIIGMTIIQLTLSLTPEIERLFLGIDTVIWLFFVGEYAFRLHRCQSKWGFIKDNKIDLIPLIPFYSFFRIFRVIPFVKVFQFIEVLQLTGMFSVLARHIGAFIKMNKLKYIFAITIVVVLLGAGGITLAENLSFWDSLWWSLVTVTTVGYGDFIPQTFLGRTVASLLMFSGVGLFGALAGATSTYIFARRFQSKLAGRSKIAVDLIDRLKDFDELSLEEVKEITSLLEWIKQNEYTGVEA